MILEAQLTRRGTSRAPRVSEDNPFFFGALIVSVVEAIKRRSYPLCRSKRATKGHLQTKICAIKLIVELSG